MQYDEFVARVKALAKLESEEEAICIMKVF